MFRGFCANGDFYPREDAPNYEYFNAGAGATARATAGANTVSGAVGDAGAAANDCCSKLESCDQKLATYNSKLGRCEQKLATCYSKLTNIQKRMKSIRNRFSSAISIEAEIIKANSNYDILHPGNVLNYLYNDIISDTKQLLIDACIDLPKNENKPAENLSPHYQWTLSNNKLHVSNLHVTERDAYIQFIKYPSIVNLQKAKTAAVLKITPDITFATLLEDLSNILVGISYIKWYIETYGIENVASLRKEYAELNEELNKLSMYLKLN